MGSGGWPRSSLRAARLPAPATRSCARPASAWPAARCRNWRGQAPLTSSSSTGSGTAALRIRVTRWCSRAMGRGVVMRADALRPATKKHAQATETKLKTRLPKGEKRNRKRIAQVTAVYEITPKVRTPADILPITDHEREHANNGPEAKNKWVLSNRQPRCRDGDRTDVRASAAPRPRPRARLGRARRRQQPSN